MKVMLKRLPALLLMFFFISFASFAQLDEFSKYTFDDTPVSLDEQYKEEKEVSLFKKVRLKLTNEGDEVFLYELSHEKILVNSDNAIERNNKIYFNIQEDVKIIANKNRVIQPDGSISVLKDSDIFEEKDEESGNTYKYYAVNGLTQGSVIEKIYITRYVPSFEGITIQFQKPIPIQNFDFRFDFPPHLEFDVKSYNGLKEATVEYGDSLSYIELKESHITPVDFDEKLANPLANLKKLKFKLAHNKYTGVKNFFNYNDYTQRAFANIHIEPEKKVMKALEEFFSKIPKSSDKKTQLLHIETYIKHNIAFNKYFNENKDLKDVITKKQASFIDLIRLYAQVFNYFNIKTELVFTTNRYQKYFDPDFETTEQLDEALLFFPELNQYLDATDVTKRSPLFDYNFGNNYGLFIRTKEFGGVKTGIPEVKYINLPSMEETEDSMAISVDFNKGVMSPMVKSRIVFGGYSGNNLQPIKDYVSEEQYQDILKDLAKNYAAEVKNIKVKAVNDGTEYLGVKDFEMQIEAEPEELVQEAGNKILFKVGELIGKQSELYQEHERQMPVEIHYPHYYYRTIDIKLPEGYKVVNPEIFNFDFKTMQGNDEVAKFISSYTLKDQKLKVLNIEFYKTVVYPLDIFNDYKAVLNAAADFNKLVLILEKI